MRKWQRLLALPIQWPQPGHFSSNDLEWSNVEDNNGQIFDCVSWIPRDRIDDFIKVVYLLYCYHQKHPVNLVLLAFFTVSLSLTVGISCAYSKGRFVLEALILTAAVVFSLTGYTFWASKKGKDFSFLGPVLFASLLVLILFGFIQIFFPLGSFSTTIYGGVAALIFSGYIVYDIDNLIKRYTYDRYIWASVVLYLDILNLFLSLLQLLWRSS